MSINKLLSIDEIQELFAILKTKKIAVIGDFCLDAYWFIDHSCQSHSLETGLSITNVKKQKYSLGGAANVVNNLKSLGLGDVDAYGVIGDDPFGNELLQQLKIIDCNTSNLCIQNVSWDTHTYSKPILQNKEINRFDFGISNDLLEQTETKLLGSIKKNINKYDMIIVNQQIKNGLHQKSFPKKLQEIISQTNTICDCRDKEIEYSSTYLKINKVEALEKGFLLEINEDQKVIRKMIDDGIYQNIFVSLGSEGCLVFGKEEKFEIPVPFKLKGLDPVGGGDSLLSGISVGLIGQWDVVKSAALGCLVASVTVQKNYQTGTATPEEIMTALEQNTIN